MVGVWTENARDSCVRVTRVTQLASTGVLASIMLGGDRYTIFEFSQTLRMRTRSSFFNRYIEVSHWRYSI
jgi:hypothetical protein